MFVITATLLGISLLIGVAIVVGLRQDQVLKQKSLDTSPSTLTVVTDYYDQPLCLEIDLASCSKVDKQDGQKTFKSYKSSAPVYNEPITGYAGLSSYLPSEYDSTPPPDFDYGRPSPTLQTQSGYSANGCKDVTPYGSTKKMYQCNPGSYPSGSCKDVTPSGSTKKMYECS